MERSTTKSPDRLDENVSRSSRRVGVVVAMSFILVVAIAGVILAVLEPWQHQALPAAGVQRPEGSVADLQISGAPDRAMLNCVNAPSSCGYPDESNTGIPAGQDLLRVPDDVSSGPGWKFDERGWVAVDEDGAVLENLQLTTPIDVQADGVAIRNVRINVSGDTWGIALRHVHDTTIENVEIAPTVGSSRLLVGIKDIYGDSTGTRVLRSDISGMSTGIQTVEGLIEGNYIHDFGYQEGDHLNGTTSNGSSQPLAILNNTVLNQYGQTDAISFFQDFGIEGNRTVSGNLLAGGGYTIYGGQNEGAPPAFNIRITGNRVAKLYFPLGGYYGPVTAFDRSALGNVWAGNIWDDTGNEIPPP